MNELHVEVRQTPGEIACNFDDIKQALAEQMTAYEGLEVTDETLKERKADVASLRKFVKAVEAKRIEVKKAYCAPLDEFENRVKELTGIVNEKVVEINAGLEEIEQKRQDEKRNHIQDLYRAEIGQYEEYIPLLSIWSDRWLNKGTSDNAIVSEIQTKKLQVMNDLNTIKNLMSPYEDELIGAYKISGLAGAMQRHADLMAAEKIVEKAVEEVKSPQMGNVLPDTEKPVYGQSGVFQVVVRITGDENIRQFKEIMAFNDIPYEEV